jgi:hypothetical protein
MKNLIIVGMMLLAAGSCSVDRNSPPDDPIIGREIIDTRMKIVLVDSLFQDRLNPELPAYFGEAYADGIKVLYLYNGRKLTFIEYCTLMQRTPIEGFEGYKTIHPPYRSTAGYDSINEGTLGYYFLDTDPIIDDEAEEGPKYVYIQYPDGNEDEIKVQLFRNERGTICLMNKIWFNDELAYAMSENYALFLLGQLPDSVKGPDSFLNYYNPKYYPWLEPILNDDGNQVGHAVRPKHGTDIVVVIK